MLHSSMHTYTATQRRADPQTRRPADPQTQLTMDTVTQNAMELVLVQEGQPVNTVLLVLAQLCVDLNRDRVLVDLCAVEQLF